MALLMATHCTTTILGQMASEVCPGHQNSLEWVGARESGMPEALGMEGRIRWLRLLFQASDALYLSPR